MSKMRNFVERRPGGPLLENAQTINMKYGQISDNKDSIRLVKWYVICENDKEEIKNCNYQLWMW